MEESNFGLIKKPKQLLRKIVFQQRMQLVELRKNHSRK